MATFSITGSWSGGTASGTWSATGLNYPQSVYYPGGSIYVTSGNGSGSWSATQSAGTSVTYTVSGSQGSGTVTIYGGNTSGNASVIMNMGISGTVSGTTMSITVSWYPEMTGSTTISLTANSAFATLPTSWSSGTPFTNQSRTFSFTGNYSTSYTFTASCVLADETVSKTLTTDQPPAVAPSWTDSVITPTARVGEAYSGLVAASGTQPITYSASGLPSGLSINSSSGAITGTPAAGSQGVYTVSLTASNGTAPNATATQTITVDRAYGEAHIYNGLNWETPGEVKVYNSTTSQWDAATLWNTADGTNWTKSF
jgi:hypothetical protein